MIKIRMREWIWGTTEATSPPSSDALCTLSLMLASEVLPSFWQGRGVFSPVLKLNSAAGALWRAVANLWRSMGLA